MQVTGFGLVIFFNPMFVLNVSKTIRLRIKKAGNLPAFQIHQKKLFTQWETNTGMQPNAVQIIKLAAFKWHIIVRSTKR